MLSFWAIEMRLDNQFFITLFQLTFYTSSEMVLTFVFFADIL